MRSDNSEQTRAASLIAKYAIDCLGVIRRLTLAYRADLHVAANWILQSKRKILRLLRIRLDFFSIEVV